MNGTGTMISDITGERATFEIAATSTYLDSTAVEITAGTIVGSAASADIIVEIAIREFAHGTASEFKRQAHTVTAAVAGEFALTGLEGSDGFNPHNAAV